MKKVEIGSATLYLGDCFEILPGLGGLECIITDPPYGMGFQSNYRAEKHIKIENDGDSAALQWACGLEASHSRYIFCRWDNLSLVPKPKSLITWVKNNWSMGDLEHEHARQTESILFYPGPEHGFPRKRPTDVILADRTANELHPTEKPVQLMAKILTWTSGCVTDPFMGAGSTGVAAVKAGRPFVGIEIEPKYFDIACARIKDCYAQLDFFTNPP